MIRDFNCRSAWDDDAMNKEKVETDIASLNPALENSESSPFVLHMVNATERCPFASSSYQYLFDFLWLWMILKRINPQLVDLDRSFEIRQPNPVFGPTEMGAGSCQRKTIRRHYHKLGGRWIFINDIHAFAGEIIVQATLLWVFLGSREKFQAAKCSGYATLGN